MLVGGDDGLVIYLVIPVVGMGADPELGARGTVRVVIPRSGRLPVVPDQVRANKVGAALKRHPVLQKREPFRRAGLVFRVARHVPHGEHPEGDLVGLVLGLREPIARVVPGIVINPSRVGRVHPIRQDDGNHPGAGDTINSYLPPPAARHPFHVDLLGEIDVALAFRAVRRLQRSVRRHLIGQQHDRAEYRGLAEYAVGIVGGARVRRLIVRVRRGPAGIAVRLRHSQTDDQVRTGHHLIHVLGVARGHVSIADAGQDGRNLPVEVFGRVPGRRIMGYRVRHLPLVFAADILVPEREPLLPGCQGQWRERHERSARLLQKIRGGGRRAVAGDRHRSARRRGPSADGVVVDRAAGAGGEAADGGAAILPGAAAHVPLRAGGSRGLRGELHRQAAGLLQIGAGEGRRRAGRDGHRRAHRRSPARDGVEVHVVAARAEAGDRGAAALPDAAIHVPLCAGSIRARRRERHLQAAGLRLAESRHQHQPADAQHKHLLHGCSSTPSMAARAAPSGVSPWSVSRRIAQRRCPRRCG